MHSSFWGGDLEAFVLQGAPRGLFEKSTVGPHRGRDRDVPLGEQIPDGTIIGARGPFGVFAPDTALNNGSARPTKKYNGAPTYPSYKMAQAILG